MVSTSASSSQRSSYPSDLGNFQNRLTKYEKTLVIGSRIEQLVYGAPSLLDEEDVKTCTNMREVAHMELKKKVLPFTITRTLPNNETSVMSVNEMIDVN